MVLISWINWTVHLSTLTVYFMRLFLLSEYWAKMFFCLIDQIMFYHFREPKSCVKVRVNKYALRIKGHLPCIWGKWTLWEYHQLWQIIFTKIPYIYDIEIFSIHWIYMELKYSVYTVLKEDIGILFTFQWNCYCYTIKHVSP